MTDLSSSLEQLDLDSSHQQAFLDTLDALAETPELASQWEELLALGAIYDTEKPALSLFRPPPTSRSSSPARPWTPTAGKFRQAGLGCVPLRLILETTVPSTTSDASHPIHLLISLSPDYPLNQPPQIQLQDLYIGPYLVTDELFGEVLRTFMHEASSGQGIEWSPGDVCVFEGVEDVRERVGEWLKGREEESRKGEVLRAGVGVYQIGAEVEEQGQKEEVREEEVFTYAAEPVKKATKVESVKCPVIVSSEPLVDRKSVFVGHVAQVTCAEEIKLVMAELLSDRKIARATHNISAYRINTPEGTLLHDNDDDGESAAGGRLAHLLSLLLGADRFKHINTAARDALVVGGFVEESEKKSKKGGKKK
ncbi:ribosomal protein S5 domain 2-type protein [Pseudohyphozyma bogoriensis]|nr:ribosomal protein S5 domain 2-type protein [Pseudohyphozyma bogoriensis]